MPPEVAQLVDRLLSRERDARPRDLRETLAVLRRSTDVTVRDFGPAVSMDPQADRGPAGPQAAPSADPRAQASTECGPTLRTPEEPIGHREAGSDPTVQASAEPGVSSRPRAVVETDAAPVDRTRRSPRDPAPGSGALTTAGPQSISLSGRVEPRRPIRGPGLAVGAGVLVAAGVALGLAFRSAGPTGTRTAPAGGSSLAPQDDHLASTGPASRSGLADRGLSPPPDPPVDDGGLPRPSAALPAPRPSAEAGGSAAPLSATAAVGRERGGNAPAQPTAPAAAGPKAPASRDGATSAPAAPAAPPSSTASRKTPGGLVDEPPF